MKPQFAIIFETKEELDEALEKLSKNQTSPPQTFFCDDCGKKVSQKVKDFCNDNFNGNVYCMTCQKRHREGQQ